MCDKLAGITAVICTFNEEKNIKDCIESVKGVDEVVVADDGSTDRTCEIAREMGAKVFRRSDWTVKVTQQDIEDFKARFGWEPSFTEGYVIRNGNKDVEEAFSFASNDWIITPDADERVMWDLPKIREQLENYDMICHPFIHFHDENGNPCRIGERTKMFRKSMMQIVGRTHTVVVPQGRLWNTDLLKIDHLKKYTSMQTGVLQTLEYSVLKDNTTRDKFYLGREYFYFNRPEESLKLLDEYLNESVWITEIEYALLLKARCCLALGKGEEARRFGMMAFERNPDHKELAYFLSTLYEEPWHSKWVKIAERATDTDILF